MYFKFLSYGEASKRHGARGSLPPTPPSRQLGLAISSKRPHFFLGFAGRVTSTNDALRSRTLPAIAMDMGL